MARVCAYRADNGIFSDPLFKDEVQTFGKQISYCVLVSHQQIEIVEHRIK